MIVRETVSDRKARISSLVGPCATLILLPVHRLFFKGQEGLFHGLMTLLNVSGPAIILGGHYGRTKGDFLPTYESLERLCDKVGFRCTTQVGRLRWTLRFGILSLLGAGGSGIAAAFISHQIAAQILSLGFLFGAFWASLRLPLQFDKTVHLASAILGRLESGDFTVEIEPPSSAKFVLLLIPVRVREHLVGDLEEEYRTIVLPKFGLRKAQFWYWEQVLLSVLPLVGAQVRRIVGLVVFLRKIS